MPARKVPLITNHTYHILNRGVARSPIFSDKRTYQHFLNLIEYYQHASTPMKYSHFRVCSLEQKKSIMETLKKKDEKLVEILAFCLMPNHFHLLLKQTQERGISIFMHKLSTSYSHYFNLRSGRVGPLLQGIFKAIRIETDEQLLHVIRYIHINPYVDFIVEKQKLLSYPWSSLPMYLEKQNFPFIKRGTITSIAGSPTKHRKFIHDEADLKRNAKHIHHLLLD